jgi:hypothetical protein
MLAPLSPSPAPPAPRPVGAQPRVLVAPVGAPQHPIYDPSSAPPPQASSPTLPSVRESTLPLHDTGSTRMRRPDRRGRMIWLGAGGLAVGAFMVVALALQSTTDTPSGPAPTPGVGAAAVEPKPKPAATAAVEPERAQEPEPEVVPSPALEPELEPDPEIVIDPTPPSEPAPTPTPEPTPRAAKTSKPKTTPPKPAPSGPPSDDALIKKLTGTIKAKCSDAMAGKAITVSFMVRTDGKIMGLNAIPKGPAAQCAMDRVKGTVFRPRAAPEPKKFTAK